MTTELLGVLQEIVKNLCECDKNDGQGHRDRHKDLSTHDPDRYFPAADLRELR